MCDACEVMPKNIPTRRRRRLWEMTGGWHCSVIGTCLSLSDLRGLARKLALEFNPNFPVDYQIHGFFAKEADSPSRAGKMLNKLLDKRHSVAIKRARYLQTDTEIRQYWAKSTSAGDIPGPYWAILSHPVTTPEFCEHLFAEVHMLSHLVGASNRADIQRIQEIEIEASALEDKLIKSRRRVHEKLEMRDRQIRELRAKLLEVEGALLASEAHQKPTTYANDDALQDITKLRVASLSKTTSRFALKTPSRSIKNEFKSLSCLQSALRRKTLS